MHDELPALSVLLPCASGRGGSLRTMKPVLLRTVSSEAMPNFSTASRPRSDGSSASDLSMRLSMSSFFSRPCMQPCNRMVAQGLQPKDRCPGRTCITDHVQSMGVQECAQIRNMPSSLERKSECICTSDSTSASGHKQGL